MIIHSTFKGFIFHILVLSSIFALTIANLIICSLALWGGEKIASIVLGCICLMLIFAYAMYISSTYRYIEEPPKGPEDLRLRKPFFNLTGFTSKGYDPIPPTYNDEAEDNA